MSEAPVHAPKGDIKLPGIGPVPKKWFLIVGGGSVVVIGYVLYKKKSSASTAAATTAATGTSALSGQPCVDENGNPGVYDDTGTCQVDTSALGGYYAGSGALGVSGVTAPVPGTGGFTTNGQWTQQAEADMEATGADPGTLSAALGAYITGQPLTSAQQSLVDQAIAMEGYPPVSGPNGYPPAMYTSPTGASGPGTCPSGFTFSAIQKNVTGEKAATGGTGWCEPVAGTGTGTTPAGAAGKITGLAGTSTGSGISVHWNAATGATEGYSVILRNLATHAQVGAAKKVSGTSTSFTGLTKGTDYNIGVQGLPGGPGANIHVRV